MAQCQEGQGSQGVLAEFPARFKFRFSFTFTLQQHLGLKPTVIPASTWAGLGRVFPKQEMTQ